MKLRPGVRYTRHQLVELIDQAEAHELQMAGYVLQHDVLSKTYTIVPWTQAGGAEEFGKLRKPRVYQDAPDFGPIDPIRKRTPAERVDSLMLRFIEDCKAAGTVPGLDDARISSILGEAWKSGRNEITAEDVRAVAASFLAKAEKQHEEKLSKQVTRHED